MSENLYADIFKTKDAEVKTFADLVRSARQEGIEVPAGAGKTGFDAVVDGTPERVVAANFTKQESRFIIIEHGWMHEDYVWHIAVRRPKVWKVSTDRIIYAIAKTMNGVIPQSIKVEIFPPFDDWEIKDYSAKAYGLRAAWNVPIQSVHRLTEKMFDVLNTLL